jgi:hypothetical protein
VILVDGRTASAEEILAAALADRGRAVVVGSETFGKGMVQTIDPLPEGGELFVTWSQTLTPPGWPLQGLGVLPQVCTSLGQGALTRQTAATGFQPMTDAIRRSRAARIPVPASDVPEIRAPCPSSEGRGTDLEAARALIANAAAYAAALLAPMGTGTGGMGIYVGRRRRWHPPPRVYGDTRSVAGAGQRRATDTMPATASTARRSSALISVRQRWLTSAAFWNTP